MQILNKDVEKFFLETIPKRREKSGKDFNISDCHKACVNYYLELENENIFNSSDYVNESERVEAMFGFILDDEEKDLLDYKFYKNRFDKYEEGNSDDIIEMGEKVTDRELVGVMPLRWWLP